jgi:hypothetical protein
LWLSPEPATPTPPLRSRLRSNPKPSSRASSPIEPVMPSKKKPSRKAKPAVQPSPKKPSPKKRTTKITVTKIGANGKRRVKIVSPSSAAAAAREEGLANEAEVRPSPVPAAVIEVAGSQSPPEDPFSEADKEPIYPPSSPVADRSEWEVSVTSSIEFVFEGWPASSSRPRPQPEIDTLELRGSRDNDLTIHAFWKRHCKEVEGRVSRLLIGFAATPSFISARATGSRGPLSTRQQLYAKELSPTETMQFGHLPADKLIKIWQKAKPPYGLGITFTFRLVHDPLPQKARPSKQKKDKAKTRTQQMVQTGEDRTRRTNDIYNNLIEMWVCKEGRDCRNADGSRYHWCWPRRKDGVHLKLEADDLSRWAESVQKGFSTERQPPSEIVDALEERKQRYLHRQHAAKEPAVPVTPVHTIPTIPTPPSASISQLHPQPYGGGSSNFTVNMASPATAATTDEVVARVLKGLMPAILGRLGSGFAYGVGDINESPSRAAATRNAPSETPKRPRDIVYSSSPAVPEGVPSSRLLAQLVHSFELREYDTERESDLVAACEAILESKMSVRSLYRMKPAWYERKGIPEWVHEPLKAYIKPFCARYEERTRGTKRLFDEVDEAGGSSQQAARAVKPVGDSGYQEARDVQLRDLPFRPSSPLAAAGPSSPISSPSPSPRPSSVLLWEPEPSSQCEPLRLSQLHGDTLSDPQQLSSSSASSERESSGDISEAIDLLDRSSTASADSRTDDLKLSSEDFEEEE